MARDSGLMSGGKLPHLEKVLRSLYTFELLCCKIWRTKGRNKHGAKGVIMPNTKESKIGLESTRLKPSEFGIESLPYRLLSSVCNSINIPLS